LCLLTLLKASLLTLQLQGNFMFLQKIKTCFTAKTKQNFGKVQKFPQLDMED
jgi:hypothetical protein